MSPIEHRTSRCVLCAVWVGVCAEGERMAVVVMWQFKILGVLGQGCVHQERIYFCRPGHKEV